MLTEALSPRYGIHRWAYWGGILVYACVIAWLFPHRYWDPDEFEHLQGSWLISQGLIPYRDYFEHHTPLWHLLTSQVFRLEQPESMDRVAILLAGFRTFSILCSATTAALTWLLARRAFGAPIAAIALALLLSESIFISKGIEIRPDPLSILGIVGATYALARAFASQPHAPGFETQPGRSAIFWTVISGIAVTLAILSSQKALFAVPGLVIAFAYLAKRRFFKLAPYALAGSLLIAAPILVWFASRGALGQFFYYNFLLNSGWVRQNFNWGTLELRSNATFLFLSVAGCILIIWRLSNGIRQPELLLAVCLLLSLVAGGAALPVVQRQYIMMALPFAAICAAGAIQICVQAVKGSKWMPVSAMALAAIILFFTAHNLYKIFYQRESYMILSERDSDMRRKLAFLLQTVPPNQTVMAAWSVGVAFRRPAWFYFFLHDEIRAMIPSQAYKTLADGLRTGAIRPALVDFDLDMAEMPPEVVAEIERLYKPVGVADFQKRLGVTP